LHKDAPDYATIAAPWNLRFAATLPAGIARCVSPEDVRACLHWAQSNEGGHSYAGFSTTRKDRRNIRTSARAMSFVRFRRKAPAPSRWPTTHDGAQWKIFLAGGAVEATPTDATAFVHRKAL
jgi:hypothetical protein